MTVIKVLLRDGGELFCEPGATIEITKAPEVSHVEVLDMTEKEYFAIPAGNTANKFFE